LEAIGELERGCGKGDLHDRAATSGNASILASSCRIMTSAVPRFIHTQTCRSPFSA
jgi:hypothetical protein